MRITIEGKTGSGKSLLGTLLCQFLRMHGYTVSFVQERPEQVFPLNWDVTEGPITTEPWVEIVEKNNG